MEFLHVTPRTSLIHNFLDDVIIPDSARTRRVAYVEVDSGASLFVLLRTQNLPKRHLSILCGRIQFLEPLEALGRQCEDLFGTSAKKAAD